jgi:hypothetical protein
MTSRWPYWLWDQGVKGQDHIDLVGISGFQSITKECLGSGTSNLVWRWPLLIFGQGIIDLVGKKCYLSITKQRLGQGT